MKEGYKVLGEYIHPVDERNRDLSIDNLLGVSIEKKFIPSIANIIGTDLSSYKIVRTGQFAYGPVTSRNGEKISIALLQGDDCIISSSYSVFEIVDKEKLDPEYLMLWFSRPEFDRYARFRSHGSVREIFDWDEMCAVELPVPSIEKQREIVKAYRAITERIELKRRINDNLEEQIKTVFRQEILSKSDAMITNGSWESRPLTALCDITYGKGLLTSELTEDGYPVYGGNGIIGFYPNYLYNQSKVIISCRGIASGKVHYTVPFSFVTSNSLVLHILNEATTPFEFILFSAYSTDFLSKVTGSAQPQLTIDGLRDIRIALPDERTIKKFTNIANKVMKSIMENDEEIEMLIHVQQNLLCCLSR